MPCLLVNGVRCALLRDDRPADGRLRRMNETDILTRRLFGQRLAGTPFESPEDVVRWLGCVQSQEALLSRWSLGQRTTGYTDADIAAAFDEGRFLRTHALRPTWHYVMPEDILWIQQATAHRVHALNAYVAHKYEVDDATVTSSLHLIATALEGGRHLTRTELGAVLEEAGIVARSIRLAYIVMHAELEGLICSGAVKGKQHTYALLAERAPQARRLDDDDEALARLTLRYFTGHGPATERDFAWWSSLPLAEIRRGLEMVRADLLREELDGQTYWYSVEAQPPGPLPLRAWILQDFDEAFWFRSLAFPDMEWTREEGTWNETLIRPILIGGRRAGTWRRKIERKQLVFEAQLFTTLNADEQVAFDAEVARYGAYMGLPVRVDFI